MERAIKQARTSAQRVRCSVRLAVRWISLRYALDGGRCARARQRAESSDLSAQLSRERRVVERGEPQGSAEGPQSKLAFLHFKRLNALQEHADESNSERNNRAGSAGPPLSPQTLTGALAALHLARLLDRDCGQDTSGEEARGRGRNIQINRTRPPKSRLSSSAGLCLCVVAGRRDRARGVDGRMNHLSDMPVLGCEAGKDGYGRDRKRGR